MYQNKLVNESSLYLQQHAKNPIHWWSWSEEAFKAAKKQNKLVLISIGYSSCHWCHVMERESFEDIDVADFMNKYFISVKVDREERPDVDLMYMSAVQLMNQRGGWPLNCFTLPDGRPIYGGTYFPKEQWLNVLNSLVKVFKEEPERVVEFADKVMSGIKQTQGIINITSKSLDIKKLLDKCVANWSKNWDLNYGGNIGAPKFPLPSNQLFLLRFADSMDSLKTFQFVELTLSKIMRGGIFDQIGGGFSRYSTDGEWHVPHFEKMLYDNAQLIEVYAEAFGHFNNDEMKRTVLKTISWLEEEMQLKNGGYSSSIDADSEGVEGAFYSWKESEVDFLEDDEKLLVKKYYNLSKEYIWEEDLFVLHRKNSDVEFLQNNGINYNDLRKIDQKLFSARAQKIHPVTDRKVITSWNAMLLKGFLSCYRYLKNEEYFEKAQKLINFIDKHLIFSQNGLLKVYRTNENSDEGFLDDYAFVIDACIEFYQVSAEKEWLDKAKKLTEYVKNNFQDEETKMCYLSKENNLVPVRSFEIQDNVVPSSNAIMASNLMKLGKYFDSSTLTKDANQMISNISKEMERYGSGYSHWSLGMLIQINGFNVIQYSEGYLNSKLLYQNTGWKELLVHHASLPIFQAREKTGIYACDDKSCSQALNDLEALNNHLKVIKEEMH